MDDVEGKRDLAKILRQGSGEDFLDIRRAVDAHNDKNGANCLRKAVLLRVCPRGHVPEPHVKGGPFKADVGTGAKVKTGDEDSDPPFSTRGTEWLRQPLGSNRCRWWQWRTFPGAIDQVGFGHQVSRQEQDDVPATVTHAKPDHTGDQSHA